MTYHVLIADDEELERRALEELIAHDAPGSPIIHTAAHGTEAAEYAATSRVDIAILDIRMPGRSGLDVATDLRRQNPDTMVIFVSAYDYFEYAQEAIRLRAQDYLIKPIEDDSLLQIVNAWYRARAESSANAHLTPFGQATRFIEQELLRELAAGSLPVDSLARGLSLFGDAAKSLRGIVAIADAAQHQHGLARRGAISDHLAAAIEQSVGAGGTTDGPAGGARIKVLRYVDDQVGVALLLGESGAIAPSRCCAATELAHNASDLLQGLRACTARLFQERAAGVSGTRVREAQIALVEAISSGGTGQIQDLAAAFWNQTDPATRHEEITALLTLVNGTLELRGQHPDGERVGVDATPKTLDDLVAKLGEVAVRSRPASARARAIFDWIDTNFTRNVSLPDLARHLVISESYCSRECVAHTGSNFVELLRNRRVSEVKRLLLSTRLKIGAIAQQTGFRDGHYLARVFRDATGTSPGKWRRLHSR